MPADTEPASPHALAPTAPLAVRRPHPLRAHGDQRVDEWYWLRERADPDVVAHLEAENAHTDAVLASLAPLRERLFEELRARVRETDVSEPVPDGPWEYFVRTEAGRSYPRYGRRRRGDAPEELGGSEQVLLDGEERATGHAYFALGAFAVAPDHRLLAFSVDHTGGERYALALRDLDAGVDLADEVPDTSAGVAWADDGSLLYVRPDDALRPFQVWRHVVGTAASDDTLILEEPDERYFVGVRRARTGTVLLVDAHSKTTSETWTIPVADPTVAPRSVGGRIADVEYEVEHDHGPDGDRYLVVANRDAPDFALWEVAADALGPDDWRPLVPHWPGVRLVGIDAFADHLVVSERADGVERLVIRAKDASRPRPVAVPDPVSSSWVGSNREYDTDVLRYGYSSLVQPRTAYDLDVVTGRSTVVKVQDVPDYDPEHYRAERHWVEVDDGARVPVSLVRRADVALDGTAPVLLYGYGAYEVSIDPTFSAARLPFLDRGAVFAIAHVRGGGELGRAWYEHGRLREKATSFRDFVACAEHLVATGVAAADRIVARGRSAGGLLMGAVLNLAPERFRAVVAEVPFVDVLTTMLDPSIPLTVTEWDEWGDPLHDAHAYADIRAYSPYDNVAPGALPDVLATGGLHDARVQYWEPAKWVLRLRDAATNTPRILLRTELGAGHGGPSGRYDAWREEAFVLAFVLDALGVAEVEPAA